MGISIEDLGVSTTSIDESVGAGLVKTILSRRSVREGYTRQRIPKDVLGKIILSGLSAPSSKGAKPWGIHIVGENDLNKISELIRGAEGADTYSPVNPITGKHHPQFVPTVSESAEVLEKVS